MRKTAAKWFSLIAAYLLFIASAVLVFQVPTLLEGITLDVPMNEVQIGLLQGMFALPAVFLALVGGSLLDGVDSRHAGILSGILMLAGNLLFNFTDNYWLMLLGRFLVGVGSIIINLVSARMLTLWFPRNQRGLAMSVLHTAWPITAGIAYSTFVELGRTFGWQNVVLGVNGFLLFALLVFLAIAPRDPESTKGEEPPTIRRLFKLPGELWITAFSWLLFTTGMISVFTFGASFLAERGYDYGRASFEIGLLMWIAVPGSILAGWIIDRWGSLRAHIFLFGAGTGAGLLAFALGGNPTNLMIFVGLLGAFTPIAVYAVPGMIVQPQHLGLAFGVILTFANIGNTIGPVLTGWIATLTGGYGSGMIAVALLLFCSAGCAALMRNHRLAAVANPNIEEGSA